MILLANHAYIPESLISSEDLKRWRYEWAERITEDAVDEFGELITDEYGNSVTDTKTVTKSLKTYERLFSPEGKEDMIAIPRGDMEKLSPWLTKYPVTDTRSTTPLGIPLKMAEHVLADPRWKDQKRCVDVLVEQGGGIVRGDTGSGKSLIGLGSIVEFKMKTLILSTRRDGNTHWTKEIRNHSNLIDLEEEYGKPLLGVLQAKKYKETWPITIATVQSFLSKNGRKRLLALQDEFGLVLVDEIHELASREFSRVLSSFNPTSRVGLTATVERSDKRHFLLFDVMGPIAAEAKAKQMPPTVYFLHTDVKAPAWVYQKKFPRHYQWNVCLKHLQGSSQRYDLIVDWLHKDLDDGRVIACISERRALPKELYGRLKEQGYDVAYVDGTTKNREDIYEKTRKGKIQVLCAGKVLNALVNIPILDCIYVITPINKKKSIEQIYGRGRRPMEGKRTPIVRYFVDHGGQLTGAYKNNKKVCLANGWEVQEVEAPRSLGMTKRIFKRK